MNRGNLITIGKNSTIGRLTRLQGKITIGKNVFVNEFCSLNAGLEDEIIIGEYTSLAPDCYLITGDHDIDKNVLINIKGDEGGRRGSIVIGKNCWIGAKSVILKNVNIGDGVVIGAGSVVTRDIPPFAVAVGNPARVIKYRK
ncbi:acyltransferase [Patescibacteria group bacterium]|nr:acyltransferase [Patescibacteria group bacterium]MBU4309259.1 acyltransferase [Patescibacteria group bacterium]MBU4432488.1 acyltransferase [Patescibacteria group bacterium]MBU4577620.1 acyltransferase [Patescibacteria group bacterium]